MKRFVIATASAVLLLAGSAAASVPKGPASRLAHDYSFSSLANGGPGAETFAEQFPAVPEVDAAGLPDLGSTIPGLPDDVTALLGTIDPALANLAETVTEPVAEALSPVIAAPAPALPGLSPAPAEPEQPKSGPARKPAQAKVRGKAVKPKADFRPAALPAEVFKDLGTTGYAGYGTASVIHADALQTGQQTLANVDAAYSAATYSSVSLPQVTNEMSRILSPALGAGNAYARGSGLEATLAGNPDPPQIAPGSIAEAKAPPSTPLIKKELTTLDASPAAKASVLRGEAQSRANTACTTGIDLANGLGYAADLGLLGAPDPAVASAASTNGVSNSRSRTYFVPQEGAASPIQIFGLASETSQTIAPVTLFKGTPQEFSIEFAGEWVLRAVADGKKGTVHYGPGEVSPQTRLLHIFGPALPQAIDVTTQMLLDEDGLSFNVPNVAEISIGEKPRAIGGDADSTPTETATLAAGAVDVVRIRLLGAPAEAADIRIGHMEVATAVPAGGITCGIQLAKTSDKDTVKQGEDFTWTIKVTNPNDCVLTNLKVVDTITATPGIKWTTQSASPKSDELGNGGVTWNDVGPLNPGQSKELTIKVKLADDTGAGRFTDVAEASGVCGPAAGTANADAAAGVPLSARVELNLPEVNAVQAGNLLPRELPRTGGLLTVVPALALTGGGLLLRQAKRRRKPAA